MSIATVSRTLKTPEVVAAQTRARVQAAADELKYLPNASARSLAARREEAHGLILPELTGTYYAELVAGYESSAEELGQSLVVVQARGKEHLSRAIARLAGRVDGLSIMGSAGLPEDLVRQLAKQLPVVVIAGSRVAGAELVMTESREAATDLTGRLLDAGRRSLLFVGDPRNAVDVQQRYQGFVQAHRTRGLPCRAPMRTLLDEEAGRAAANRVLRRRQLPDGLVCANDLLALAMMARLEERGVKVPGDIPVTGWDDVMAARYIRPRLTTARQPVRELAAHAAHRIHLRVDGEKDWGRTHVLPCEVVVRESCGTAEPEERGNQ